MNWSAVTAVSAAVSALVVMVAGAISVIQLREIKRTRRLDLTLKILDDLTLPGAWEARRFVYEDLPGTARPLSSTDLARVDQVLTTLDRMWIVLEERQVERRLVFDNHGPMVVRLWRALEPTVKEEPHRRGSWYHARAELLAEEAAKYFTGLGVEIPAPYPPDSRR